MRVQENSYIFFCFLSLPSSMEDLSHETRHWHHRQNSKRNSCLSRQRNFKSLWCKYCEKSLVSPSSHHFVLKAVVITQKCMAAAQEIKTFKEVLPFQPNDQKEGHLRSTGVRRILQRKELEKESLKFVYKCLSCAFMGHIHSNQDQKM